MHADKYSRRIGRYDQAIREAQLKANAVPRQVPQPAGLPMAEYAANCRLSPEHVAVVHAQLDRERAMREWEREMDAEDELGMYGLIPLPRKADNVIEVDFTRRARVSRTRSTCGGR